MLSYRLLDDRLLIGIVVNREVAQDAQPIGDQSGILPQHPHSEGVERAHGQSGGRIGRQ